MADDQNPYIESDERVKQDMREILASIEAGTPHAVLVLVRGEDGKVGTWFRTLSGASSATLYEISGRLTALAQGLALEAERMEGTTIEAVPRHGPKGSGPSDA